MTNGPMTKKMFSNDKAQALVAGVMAMVLGGAILIIGTFIVTEIAGNADVARSETLGLANGTGAITSTALDIPYPIRNSGITVTCLGKEHGSTANTNGSGYELSSGNYSVVWTLGSATVYVGTGGDGSGTVNCSNTTEGGYVNIAYTHYAVGMGPVIDKTLDGMQIGGIALLAIGGGITLGALTGALG